MTASKMLEGESLRSIREQLILQSPDAVLFLSPDWRVLYAKAAANAKTS
jgi:hypothetical protein